MSGSATEYLGELAAGKTTPGELVQSSLERIERWQTLTNAFSQTFRSAAEHAGRIADAERSSAGPGELGPLHGIPFAVKDLFDVAGYPTTGCSRFYEGNLATSTATVVQRLQDAGAIVVGKTNQHELAMGGTNLLSSAGPTRNPFDPGRITGGSSGGSAAALATRTVPLALGTDTGGSIRNPASFCGLFGLKPTQGRLPSEGVMPLAPSLDCPGPMTTTAGDLDLMWWVLSGVDEDPRPVSRVGLLGGFFAEVHPAVREALDATVEALRAQGISVVDVDGTSDPRFDMWGDFVCMELVAAHPGLAAKPELLFERTAFFVAKGAGLSELDRNDLRRIPDAIRQWFARRLEGVDVLLAPSAPYPAPLAGQDDVDMGNGTTLDVHLGGTSRFTRPVNLGGCPALTIPAGRTDGLPVGVQLIGRWNDEATLIGLATDLEAADPRFRTSVPAGVL